MKSVMMVELPNEHLLTFNQYKDAKTLFAAIQTRFVGNEATKKTQKTLLKQMYENFSALSTKSLDFNFNRLQKIAGYEYIGARVLSYCVAADLFSYDAILDSSCSLLPSTLVLLVL
ncbi:hypothetical protein Tco_1243679 [Tanacetum coccineum]